MQTEAARMVGVVVEGAGGGVGGHVVALNSAHGAVVGGGVDGGAARRYVPNHHQQIQKRKQQQQLQHHPQIGTVPHLLAGGVAGAVSKTCTAPLARLTILFQAAPNQTLSIPRQYLQSVPILDRHRDNVTADVCVRLLGGGLSGLTAAAMTYPLDLVRTRLAAQTNEMYYRGISHTLHTIWRDEGIRGLYKGLGATLLGVGPSIAISFSVYETLRSHWHLQRPRDSPVLVSLACGSLSGIASSTVTFPIDLVRRRMQLEGAGGRARVYNSGILGTFRHIFQNEGIRGLYRGILPEYTKVVPGVGIAFMTYETLKILLTNAAVDE
ncbi:Mitochondrial adenine nucleotide transporter ADNT1 [Acorus gramineus]|uniref:Mitochondrial adenine nucleotide transporter ADNT1 n=1 Tax=Acorus gramineus TaxID=55184 RepID=A0AAV9B724_ACOGR|nr:Mitochondrial adenine nucleotide transporter ADNT1 [Acorus gramineus]